MRLQILFATVGALALAVPAFPQVHASGACSGSGETLSGSFRVNEGVQRMPQPITGAPYSAKESRESVRTLADGAHITNKDNRETMTSRDSYGRIRSEEHALAGKPESCFTFLSEIQDPTTGYAYILDPVDRVAFRVPLVNMKAPRSAGEVAPVQRPVRAGGPTRTSESLGTRTMLGVTAVGTRETTTQPANAGLGIPVTQATESWTVPELALRLYSKTTSAGNENTTTLKDLSTAEPAAALFQVPAGYRTVDEPGPFTLTVPYRGPASTTAQAAPGTCASTMPAQFAQQQVTGAPYSARESSERSLPRGGETTLIPRGADRVTWRDSAGRTRIEHQAPEGQHQNCASPIIISDPVAGYMYVLDTANLIAHRMTVKAMPPSSAENPVLHLTSKPGDPNRHDEPLGSKTMFGVTVVGIKTTTIHPAGSIGNDRALSETHEYWASPQLGLIVYSKTSGREETERISEMADLTAAEPDPSLFRVPAGYKIVDETGPVIITNSRAN